MPSPPAPSISALPTPPYAGYNLAWSPFYPDRLAVAGSANYGLVGNGRLSVVTMDRAGTMRPHLRIDRGYDTQDGLYDVAWSEVHENQVVTASGDGSIKLWDITLPDHPIRNWAEHSREAFSVDWSNVQKELFATSSWDASVRVWHPERPHSLLTLTSHTACVYACAWSPHHAQLLASASGDGHLRIFDLRSSSRATVAGLGPSTVGPGQAPLAPVATVPVGGEVLSLDWNKYDGFALATGSTDRAVKTWDMRMGMTKAGFGGGGGGGAPPVGRPGMMTGLQREGDCTTLLMGHEYAVRRVAWSPHAQNVLASASYDMSARIWDVSPHNTLANPAGPRMPSTTCLQRVHEEHTEFVVGLGWSYFHEGLIASCSWDCQTHLWSAV